VTPAIFAQDPTFPGEAVAPAADNPIRAYARDAVEATRLDEVHGVLVWRIAELLCQQLRHLTNKPAVRLYAVPPNEQAFYLGLARAVESQRAAIETIAPPTPGESRRYQQRKALELARARVRLESARLGHELDVFRPDDRAGWDLAFCRKCRAGVSLHLDTAVASVSEQLEAPCQPLV